MRAWVLMPVLMLGCDPASTSGGLFEPIAEAPPAVVAAPAPVDPDAFNFDDDARDPEQEGVVEPDEDGEPLSLAAALGLPEPEPVEEPDPAPEPEVVTTAVAPAPAWNPNVPIVGDWGVRVISTTPEAQPPVAVLGFGSGPDLAVRPGDLLAQHGIVVMAIGRDAVQVAKVSPDGDHARVVSQVLPVLTRSPALLSVQ